jgi:hypothetical protein
MLMSLSHQVRVFNANEQGATPLERAFALRFSTYIRHMLKDGESVLFTEVSTVHRGDVRLLQLDEEPINGENVFRLYGGPIRYNFVMAVPPNKDGYAAWNIRLKGIWMLVDTAGSQGLSALYQEFKRQSALLRTREKSAA